MIWGYHYFWKHPRIIRSAYVETLKTASFRGASRHRWINPVEMVLRETFPLRSLVVDFLGFINDPPPKKNGPQEN